MIYQTIKQLGISIPYFDKANVFSLSFFQIRKQFEKVIVIGHIGEKNADFPSVFKRKFKFILSMQTNFLIQFRIFKCIEL